MRFHNNDCEGVFHRMANNKKKIENVLKKISEQQYFFILSAPSHEMNDLHSWKELPRCQSPQKWETKKKLKKLKFIFVCGHFDFVTQFVYWPRILIVLKNKKIIFFIFFLLLHKNSKEINWFLLFDYVRRLKAKPMFL